MQRPHIRLREIVWEITGRCKNGCKYCGSKTVQNNELTHAEIVNIAEAISYFPPEEINISGGDPLTLPVVVHDDILKWLKSAQIICKIIVNPKSIGSYDSLVFDILKKYDWAGISINTREELVAAKTCLIPSDFENYTVITNFNVQNLYEFEEIEEFVKRQNKMWTIQFTVYQDENNPLALYNPDNQVAFETLQNKVLASSAKIILSDNIREDIPCGAGFNSIGITYDGYVIPCLSMRSWKDIEAECKKGIYKNIFGTSLEEIWETSFCTERFGAFKCCKDICLNKTLCLKKVEPISIDLTSVPKEDWQKRLEEEWEKMKGKINIPSSPQVVMYGVITDNVVMYAVVSPSDFGNVYAYAVSYPQNRGISLMYGIPYKNE